ncbi:hypothetical protein [Marinomonas algarum]|uniref:Uncharacterized protein n=1 Tax=Marinomonas algarum TaxID=2883105 RepID=A0A9X1LEP9_9GAMM|nr:hypothetical protein [Marinomonas algarum]MCB5161803.1 hypothetical protein [Marinomonas algarum]
MAVVTVSLQKRLQQTALGLVLMAFIAITLSSLYFIEVQNGKAEEQKLALKHQIVEQAFNSYLTRAEAEMTFIGQDLALRRYEEERALDVLFGHHEVLFFGGLDFFYIEWRNGEHAMDPRARLFTEVEFDRILKNALLNQWVSVVTKDGASLLVLKTQLLSANQQSMGSLYGFIALNDNLTLGSELLQSAQVSQVSVYDTTHKRLLMEETVGGVDLSGAVLRSSLPLQSAIQGTLQLDIVQQHDFASNSVPKSVPLLLIASAIFACFYFFLSRAFKTFLFQPLARLALDEEQGVLPFYELQTLQQQGLQHKEAIQNKQARFTLLAESVHSAVIFCNEVAQIELMNGEAEQLFPEASDARTLFDFMPIVCHQAIQSALKGDVGVTFTLTMNEVGSIYQWQAYSYYNENRFRSVLLIGRNVTEETRLSWQLEQLQPLSTAVLKKADTDALISELSYLVQLPEAINDRHIKGWLTLLLSVLSDIRTPVFSDDESDGRAYYPLGDVFAEESAQVMAAMGSEANRVILECSAEMGQRKVEVDAHFRGLIRVLLMMAMSNDMAERRLTVQSDGPELEMTVMNDMAFRPLFFWIIETLLTPMGGQYTVLQNNALRLNTVVKEWLEEADLVSSVSSGPSMHGQVVAWITNDYPHAEEVEAMLLRFGLIVEMYESSHRFFTQPNTKALYAAVFIGCDTNTAAQAEMTSALRQKHQGEKLPIIWLNSTHTAKEDRNVLTLKGCCFDYNLHKALKQALALPPIPFRVESDQEMTWLVVGGSRVAKAIWYASLAKFEVTTQWLDDLSDDASVFSYYGNAQVILLEPQPSHLLVSIQYALPNIRFFSVQRWQGMPDNVVLSAMEQPYSNEKISEFAKMLMRYNKDPSGMTNQQ